MLVGIEPTTCCQWESRSSAAPKPSIPQADDTRWIRTFFTKTLACIPDKILILDWWHLAQKCLEANSRICRGKVAHAQFLEAYRPHAKNEPMLESLIAYLHAREAWILNDRQRRIHQQYGGSEHVEKANDLIVAGRQKGRGMHWSLATSDILPPCARSW